MNSISKHLFAARVVLRHLRKDLLVLAGKRDWVTVKTFSREAIASHYGTSQVIACQWRDQICRLSGRTRRQSNFGHGWATEDESGPVRRGAWWHIRAKNRPQKSKSTRARR